jgi:hypothetical protein
MKQKISSHADGGPVLAPGSAHARPSAQPPINVSENFPVHVSGVGGAEIFSDQLSRQIRQF